MVGDDRRGQEIDGWIIGWVLIDDTDTENVGVGLGATTARIASIVAGDGQWN